jgi:hypothetical protein
VRWLGTIELGFRIPALLPADFDFCGIIAVRESRGWGSTGPGFVGDVGRGHHA